MRMPLTSIRPYFLLVLGMMVLLSAGCRSTRSGLSQWPGMSWVAPSDEKVLASWDEKDEPTLPAPSKSATPQLATKSGTTALSSEGSSSDSVSRSAVEPAGRSSVANSEPSYPDTGYPKLHQPAPAAAGAYRADDSRRPGTEFQASGREPNLSQPQRGFYGDPYAEPSAAPATASSEYASDANSRYGSYGDDSQTNGYSRYGSANEIPPPSSRSAYADQPLVSDSDQGYDPYGGQAYDRSLEDGPADQRYPAEFADNNPTGLADGARQMTETIREDYQRTTEEVRSRLEGSAAAISGKTREITEDVQDLARQASGQVERGATELGREIQEGYSRFSSGPSEPYGAENPAALAAGASTLDGGRSAATETTAASLPAGTYGQDNQSSSAVSSRSRNEQPWRPGSTQSYAEDDRDQTRRPAASPSGEIEPVSYPANVGSQPRLTPTYR